jgi:hypothetical protein
MEIFQQLRGRIPTILVAVIGAHGKLILECLLEIPGGHDFVAGATHQNKTEGKYAPAGSL